jgi:hypothetical protein
MHSPLPLCEIVPRTTLHVLDAEHVRDEVHLTTLPPLGVTGTIDTIGSIAALTTNADVPIDRVRLSPPDTRFHMCIDVITILLQLLALVVFCASWF